MKQSRDLLQLPKAEFSLRHLLPRGGEELLIVQHGALVIDLLVNTVNMLRYEHREVFTGGVLPVPSDIW